MILLNGDEEVVYFDPESYTVEVVGELPFALSGRLKSSGELRTMQEWLKNYDLLRHYFAGRVLTLSRQNAKSILQSLGESQRLTEEESYRLSLKCRAVSVIDNYWVRGAEESLTFDDVNVRKRKLEDCLFQVSIEGTPVSLQHDLLAADIAVGGMFRKTWVREQGDLYLYKSDYSNGYVNTKCEAAVSKILDATNVLHVGYGLVEKQGIVCSKCKCFTNDEVSFVPAQDVRDWCGSQEKFMMWIRNYTRDFANMVVCDYVLANPDRHGENWGFCVGISGMAFAPLFDHNQALIAIELGKEKEFDELRYPPTGETMREAVAHWAKYSDVKWGDFDVAEDLAARLRKRVEIVERFKNVF